MQAADFHPEDFARGLTHRLLLEFDAAGSSLAFPVILVRGRRPGRVLVASAGVHGDEYEGMRAILDLTESLDPEQMQGDLLAVPVLNVVAFRHGARRSPLDGLDLARVFPGVRDGSPTQALAWHFDQFVLSRADFYIDLHSAGAALQMPVLVGYDVADLPARDAAYAFGAPVVWAHPNTPPGRTVSAAKARKIACLYAEAGGGGRIDPDELAIYLRGLRNLLCHLEILSFAGDATPPPLTLHGDGNIDESLKATRDGLLKPEASLLEEVEEGRLLGTLLDLDGRPLEQYRAPRNGRVVLIHGCPRVASGEPVFLVTGVAD